MDVIDCIVCMIVIEISVIFVQVIVVIGFLDGGVIVLFVVCYCKEIIGGLDDM